VVTAEFEYNIVNFKKTKAHLIVLTQCDGKDHLPTNVSSMSQYTFGVRQADWTKEAVTLLACPPWTKQRVRVLLII
jgi:hypothetical protein